MEKTKLLTIAVIGLLLLNIGTLAFLWLNNKPKPPSESGRLTQNKALDFIMDEADYDDAQRTACIEILRTHRLMMDRIHTAIREKHNIMFDNLAKGDTSQAALIGDLYQQNEMEIFRYFTALRNVGRDDQKAKFDRIIEQAMRIMPPPRMKE